MEQDMTQQYRNFYESVQEFVLRTGLSREGELVGASDSEIKDFEKLYDINFPLAFKIYLNYFGKKCIIRSTGSSFSLTFGVMEKALERAKQENVIESIKENNAKINFDYDYPEDNPEGGYYPEIKSLMDLNYIYIYSYYPEGGVFSFLNTLEENPIMYYLMTDIQIDSRYHSFTTEFRNILYVAISLNAKTEFTLVDQGHPLHAPVNCKGMDWLKNYISIYKKDGPDYDLRLEFYPIMQEREKKEGRIFTMGEYETEFINFLRAKGFAF